MPGLFMGVIVRPPTKSRAVCEPELPRRCLKRKVPRVGLEPGPGGAGEAAIPEARLSPLACSPRRRSMLRGISLHKWEDSRHCQI